MKTIHNNKKETQGMLIKEHKPKPKEHIVLSFVIDGRGYFGFEIQQHKPKPKEHIVFSFDF